VDLRVPRRARLLALPAAFAVLIAGALPAAAHAQQLPQPPSYGKPPPFHRLSANRAIAIARADGTVKGEERKRGHLAAYAYLDGPVRWQVSFFQGGKERAQVIIDDPSGAIAESWTGWQVAWKMGRGYSGQFGGKLNAPYVWLPLCLLFVLPFVDPRRPFRLLHLDLLALLGFGVSHFFFNRGDISASVPLVYPVLVYLLVRMLWAGFRAREGVTGARVFPLIPAAWLALAVLFLAGFRVALNVADSSVIDVGYSGVIGAHRIAHGHGLYSGRFAADDEHGDTYGPVNYLLYLPFERVLGFEGHWGDLPAAHAAAIAFDLLTLLGLFLLGRRMRAGPQGFEIGVALAFAWVAYPYTDFALQSNSNDSAVAMLVVWALVALSSAPLRGATVALAAAAKFAPAALAPLFVRGRSVSQRSILVAAAVVVVVVVAAFAPFIPHGGVSALWDRTLGYQAGRESPFSLWGQHSGLSGLHVAVEVAAAALALVVAFVPRGRRSIAQVAALGAAVLIALQLGTVHWFYLYIPWFAPLVFVAVLGTPRAAMAPAAARERARVPLGAPAVPEIAPG
jgi:glycosyl transferase family 87